LRYSWGRLVDFASLSIALDHQREPLDPDGVGEVIASAMSDAVACLTEVSPSYGDLLQRALQGEFDYARGGESFSGAEAWRHLCAEALDEWPRRDPDTAGSPFEDMFLDA
jgi:hypothetical protein